MSAADVGVQRTLVVYHSSRVDQLYLFVDADSDLERVPAELLARFGTPRRVMSIDVWPARKLARADAASVLSAVANAGYYLQLPPPR